MRVGGLYCIDVISYSCCHICNECEVRFLDSWFLLGLVWKPCSVNDIVVKVQILCREVGHKLLMIQYIKR